MKSWKTEKTEIIKIKDIPVIIKELPEDIIFDVETYDRLKTDYLDCLYEQQKLKLAIETQFNTILSKIMKLKTDNPQMENSDDSTTK